MTIWSVQPQGVGFWMRLLAALQFQFAKEQVCKSCNHPRKWHSFQGCTGDFCICLVKYMDREMFE